MKCAVCNGKYSRHYTLKVTLSKYDMTNELVTMSLSGVYTEFDRICKKCHYKLRQHSIETNIQNVCMCVMSK